MLEHVGMKRKKATQVKQRIQLKEINQQVPVTERRLKRYRDKIKQYSKNRTFQNNEKNSTSK